MARRCKKVCHIGDIFSKIWITSLPYSNIGPRHLPSPIPMPFITSANLSIRTKTVIRVYLWHNLLHPNPTIIQLLTKLSEHHFSHFPTIQYPISYLYGVIIITSYCLETVNRICEICLAAHLGRYDQLQRNNNFIAYP